MACSMEQGLHTLPPVIECSLEKCDSGEFSQSTADTTLVPSSCFSNQSSPSSSSSHLALRHRGSPTPPQQPLELPTIVESGSRKRILFQPPGSSDYGPARWMITASILFFAVAAGCLAGYHFAALAAPSGSILQVDELPSEMERQLLQSRITQHQPGRSFTIRLRGSHLSFVRKAVHRYASCPGVHEIQLDWRGSSLLAPTATTLDNPKVVALDHRTLKGVLLLDETVNLSCEDVANAFLEWRHDPTRAVGFFPLFHEGARYALLSDRALFVHRSYLTPITTTSSSSRSTTHHNHACQEYVTSARVSALSEKHALAMAWKSSQPAAYSADFACYSLVKSAVSLTELASSDTVFVGGRK